MYKIHVCIPTLAHAQYEVVEFLVIANTEYDLCEILMRLNVFFNFF